MYYDYRRYNSDLVSENNDSQSFDQTYLIRRVSIIVPPERKINTTKDDYKKALATDDPTKITTSDLENLAKEAVKKFKSL
jgi:hypothetical protein